MFSQEDNTAVNYNAGYQLTTPSLVSPYRLKQQFSYNLLLSGFSVIRTNCEEACSSKLLAELSDEDKQETRDNSKISQINMKTRQDDTQNSFDSCLRRCFGKFEF